MNKLFYILVFCCGLFSCSGDTPGGDNGGSTGSGTGSGSAKPENKPQIELNVTTSNFTTEGGENEIKFTAPEPWTAQVISSRTTSWCAVEPTSGPAGEANVSVTTTPNDTPDDRTAIIVIKSGSLSKTITVSQKQKNALTLTASKFELTTKGGEVVIEVKANISYECIIDEAAKSWVTYKGTRALRTSSVVLQVAENTNVGKRSGKVTVKGDKFNETVNIYQAGIEPSIVISQNEYTVSSDGGTIAVDVASNVNVEVELPANAGWVSENTSRSTSSYTYRFDIAANPDYNQRTSEIQFVNRDNNLAETVKVTQAQKDALVVAKDSYTIETKGGQLQVEVGHNVEFNVSANVSWITLTSTRAYTTSNLVFNVKANDTTNDREGIITITSKDGKMTQTIKVIQLKNNSIDASIEGWEESEDGGTAED